LEGSNTVFDNDIAFDFSSFLISCKDNVNN
jgi:hypothetical protein